jgi:hypothetical protein
VGTFRGHRHGGTSLMTRRVIGVRRYWAAKTGEPPRPGRPGRVRPVRVAAQPRYFSPSRTVLKYAADISRMTLALVVASAFIHSI